MLRPRQEIFDTYWRFAALRQQVFFSRIRNAPLPWVTDDIIGAYKFCNAYRASDRVSQYLIRNVIYTGSQHEEEVVFRILLFKIFNKIETWEYLSNRICSMTVANFDFDVFSVMLEEASKNQPIYTSAYMSCATKAYGHDRKHENHLALIDHMIRQDQLHLKICATTTFNEVFRLLNSYPLIGNFMAYQLATDINYSEAINFSEDSFTIAGPGAERGISKCFIDKGGKSNDYIIRWMCDNQECEFERLGIEFQSLWGRRLHLIDCQNLFCETDKYCRVAFPNLTSNRKRIKSKFQPNVNAINYFYPPKWGLNDLVHNDVSAIDRCYPQPPVVGEQQLALFAL